MSLRVRDTIASMIAIPEHGDEQVDEQDVGHQQVNHQQDHHQPVAVRDPARLLAGIDQRFVVGALHIPRLSHCSGQKLQEG